MYKSRLAAAISAFEATALHGIQVYHLTNISFFQKFEILLSLKFEVCNSPSDLVEYFGNLFKESPKAYEISIETLKAFSVDFFVHFIFCKKWSNVISLLQVMF